MTGSGAPALRSRSQETVPVTKIGGRRLSGVAVQPIIRPDAEPPTTSRALRVVPDLQDGEQQALDLVFPSPQPFVPIIVPTHPVPDRNARATESWESEGVDDQFFERQPTGREQLPEPQAWARRYSQAWVEVLVGRRPTKQLTRWSTPAVIARLTHRAERHRSARAGRAPQVVVTGIRVDEPADGVAEVAAVIRSSGRSRALMLRLEGWDGRWVCTYAALI